MNRFFLIGSLFLQIAGVSCSAKKTPADNFTMDTIPVRYSPLTLAPENSNTAAGVVDFVAASKQVTPAVVHIKTIINGIAMGSGSGVIITENGYIATNNHVVEDAAEIQVILPDKRVFAATLTGRDPNTDLALIKINATGLPLVKFGNSDLVEVGQWVLAVGYPFSLNTTVTAGIVSAKARSIGIIQQSGSMSAVPQHGNTAVESFIQTDAAINPGNSGGALVNINGELIGINSAIASQTGSYAGYAFAIPANLCRKILEDLQRYGAVKRGVLGVSFPSPSAEDQFFQQKGLVPGSIRGVYITGVSEGGAAAAAGLKEGDVIQSIDGVQLSSSSEFSERIARRRPGETTQLTYLRDGKTATISVVLKADESAGKNEASLGEIYNRLGASFEPLTNALKQRYNLNQGVVVTEVRRGGFFAQAGIPVGTIIAFINGKAVNNSKDIDAALLSAQRGNVQIFAIAPDGSKVSFNFSLGT
ncbi:MAG: deoxyribonuclease HsdR [Ferruginibacter sp.]|nr:deoxyribonuclease HsdR [Ferruginibacter sp.]